MVNKVLIGEDIIIDRITMGIKDMWGFKPGKTYVKNSN